MNLEPRPPSSKGSSWGAECAIFVRHKANTSRIHIATKSGSAVAVWNGVSQLHPSRFLHERDSSYGALTFSPVGLSPTEHASLRWTHSCPKTQTNSRPLRRLEPDSVADDFGWESISVVAPRVGSHRLSFIIIDPAGTVPLVALRRTKKPGSARAGTCRDHAINGPRSWTTQSRGTPAIDAQRLNWLRRRRAIRSGGGAHPLAATRRLLRSVMVGA